MTLLPGWKRGEVLVPGALGSPPTGGGGGGGVADAPAAASAFGVVMVADGGAGAVERAPGTIISWQVRQLLARAGGAWHAMTTPLLVIEHKNATFNVSAAVLRGCGYDE